MAMQPWMDVVSTLETDFILRAIAEGIREDGRRLMERRPVSSRPTPPSRRQSQADPAARFVVKCAACCCGAR